MKIFSLVLLLVFVIAVSTDTIEERWTKFKKDFNRNYSPNEDAERFEIFKKTVNQVDAHNEKYERGEVTWSMGINDFADKKHHELPGFYRGVILPKQKH
ncbi:hypothetical protein PVAND_013792 [Polypedilum vanderplanki]|uniref:Cathepsin propeptide inhibitor domain-containing protein n=1 Tax=Polypedilum vanderplanki TaxID=319348 RepID=A0A9J6CRT2_POLVA|nr:hypothetical protein PVAND_013792 [Polypedilum vanderplanki]